MIICPHNNNVILRHTENRIANKLSNLFKRLIEKTSKLLSIKVNNKLLFNKFNESEKRDRNLNKR